MIRYKSIRVGVVFDQVIHAGGGYNQSINAILLLKDLPDFSTSVVVITLFKQNINFFESNGFQVSYFRLNIFQRVVRFIRNFLMSFANSSLINKIIGKSTFEKHLNKNDIDLVYFISPNDLYKDLSETNYIYTVWDLCHRDHPEFPEIRANRGFELREKQFSEALTKAVGIIVDSELGKQNLSRRFTVDLDRVFVIPFSPSISINNGIDIDVKKLLDISTEYIFYPAQFWAHKNHIYILHGLKILEEKFNISIFAVFSGVDKGNLSHIKSVAKELQILNRVRFVGYIEDNKMASFYKQSLGLVMPTYFGPTNLPPFEAFHLGVPVLYSDLRGLKEQVEDAALLLDLSNASSLATHLYNLITDSSLKNILTNKGKTVIDKYNEIDRLNIILNILQQFKVKHATWK